MKEELSDKLYEKYPEIFSRKESPNKSMCHLECDDGWFDILDTLCGQIKQSLESHKDVRVEVVQIKEKFGGLRFYYDFILSEAANQKEGDFESLSSEISKMVMEAEAKSDITCESCGLPGAKNKVSWIKTMCPSCHEKRLEAYKIR